MEPLLVPVSPYILPSQGSTGGGNMGQWDSFHGISPALLICRCCDYTHAAEQLFHISADVLLNSTTWGPHSTVVDVFMSSLRSFKVTLRSSTGQERQSVCLHLQRVFFMCISQHCHVMNPCGALRDKESWSAGLEKQHQSTTPHMPHMDLLQTHRVMHTFLNSSTGAELIPLRMLTNLWPVECELSLMMH